MVFQDWSLCVTTSHLSYTFDQGCHCEAIVKVHGVLPSSRWYSASSRRIQFHRVHVGDSGAVVTPFVQVATYATRNFATLGQLELLPPFTGGFHSKLITLLLTTLQHRAGVRLYTSCYHLAESCVFNKQSLPPGMCRFPNQKIGEHPFSRSYGVILPSSFDMVLSSALVYSTCSPVSVWGTVSSPGGSPSQFEVFSWKFQPC